MAIEARFTVVGEPNGKGRPQFSTHGGYVKAHTPEKTVMYENLIKWEYSQQCKGIYFDKDVPLFVGVNAYYGIAKSTSKKKRKLMIEGALRPLKKPDGDNVIKSLFDALNKVAYYDDVQIVDLVLRRFYSETPRLEVEIRSLE